MTAPGIWLFFWECKPVSRIALSATSFEYVLIPSTELEGDELVVLPLISKISKIAVPIE